MSIPATSDWISIGNAQILVLSDGTIWMDGGAIFGLTPRLLWERAMKPDALNRLPLALNCLLIRSEEKTILVDTGIGSKLTPKEVRNYTYQRDGGLLGSLQRLGIRVEEVDVVINTHLHADHCGGNTSYNGERPIPTFPKAEYWVQRAEWEVAIHPNERTRATYLPENFVPLEEHGVLRLIEGKTMVTSEVVCLPTPGHTPGHQSVVVESKGKSAIYLADVAPYPVHLERLPWIAAFDTEPLIAIETKRTLIEQIVREKALVTLEHASFPGLGHLVKDKDKIHWQSS